jgi:hypothetical protein
MMDITKRLRLPKSEVKSFRMKDLQQEVLPNTIRGVLKVLLKNPLAIIWRWHWKAAVLSGLFRAPIFFLSYKKEGIALAIGAMFAQFFSRMIFGGVNGSIIQSFSRVEPKWHAFLTVPLVLATFSHLIEFLVQSVFDNYNGTSSMGKAITVSVAISILSAIFNLYIMSRGSFLVKDERQQSLWKDLQSAPRLIFDFVAFVPLKICEMIGKKNYGMSLFTAILTSLTAGTLIGMSRGKLNWGIIASTITLGLIVISVILIFALNNRKLRQLESD